MITPAQQARLAFAAQVVLCVHRAGSGVNPCGAFYCVDGPDGWDRPMKLCGCNWPAWELRGS